MQRITLKIEPGSKDNDVALAYLNKLGHKKTKYIVSCICQMLKTNGISSVMELEELTNDEILQLTVNAKEPKSEEITMQLEALKGEVRELINKYDQANNIIPIKEEPVIKETENELSTDTLNNLMGNIALD